MLVRAEAIVCGLASRLYLPVVVFQHGFVLELVPVCLEPVS